MSSAASCPVCGLDNACAMIEAGAGDKACWCTTAVFVPALVARIPDDRRGLACVCATCAATWADAATAVHLLTNAQT